MKKTGSFKDVMLKVAGFLIIIAIWEAAAFIVQKNLEHGEIILPNLYQVLTKSLPNIAGYGGAGMGEATETGIRKYLFALKVLAVNSGYTLARVFIGLCGGLVIGIGLGLLVGFSDTARRIVFPPVEFIRQTPLLALLTLFVLWFGGRELGIYLYVFYGVSVMIFVNTVNAIRNVPGIYTKFALTLGASKREIYYHIVVPAIVPELLGGIRVIIGIVWAIGMAGEYFMAQKGLGRIMIMSEYFQFTGQMIIIVMIYIVFAFVTDKVLVRVFSRVLRWAPTLRNA